MKKGFFVIMLLLVVSSRFAWSEYVRPQRSFYAISFEVSSSVTTYVMPDTAFSVLAEELSNAENFVEIAVYEFWSDSIFALINSTARRGVKIRILLEGDVYGTEGDTWNRYMLNKLYQLNKSGLPVWIRLEDVPGYLHMKIVIIDNSTVLIGSENFVPTAYPENPSRIKLQPYSTASRGWGVAIRCEKIARYFHEVFNSIFLDDTKSHDYNPDTDGVGSEPPTKGILDYDPSPIGISSSRNIPLAPVLSPENSLDIILWIINQANYTIFIEQMYILSGDEPVMEILNALYQAVRRGVTVQIIVEDNYPGNYYEIYQDLQKHGIHVVRAFSKNPKLFMHNKAIIIDDMLVLIGSINWSGKALTWNREAGILLKSREVAMYFHEVYSLDWNQSSEQLFDSDGDMLSDIYEKEHGYNPKDPDTDHDGINDWEEVFIHGNKYGEYKQKELSDVLIIVLIVLIIVAIVILIIMILQHSKRR